MTNAHLAAALAEAEEEIRAEAEARRVACQRYAEHLAAGGEASILGGWKAPKEMEKAKPYAKEIANGDRQDRGLLPNPYSPVYSHYETASFLLARGEEFTLAAEITAMLSGKQVEATFKDYHLRDAGYRLDKGKIDGRVAYRIVQREETT